MYAPKSETTIGTNDIESMNEWRGRKWCCPSRLPPRDFIVPVCMDAGPELPLRGAMVSLCRRKEEMNLFCEVAVLEPLYPSGIGGARRKQIVVRGSDLDCRPVR